MEKIKGNIFKIIGGTIFTVSAILLSFFLILNDYYFTYNIILTACVTCVCAIYFYIKTSNYMLNYVKDNKGFSIISFVLAIIVFIRLYFLKIVPLKSTDIDIIKFDVFNVKVFALSFISFLYLFLYVIGYVKKFLLDIYGRLDSFDKKVYAIFTAVFSLAIIILFSFNSNWFMQYDKVYSLDSGKWFLTFFRNPSYYDIRHPLLGIIIFPIWAIVDSIVNVLIPSSISDIVVGIILQLFNIQLLLLIASMLKIITKNKAVFIMYILSFSTLLYTVFFEKYQICTFFIVAYVYLLLNKKEESNLSVILATGFMPTSAFIGISELITKEKFLKKILKILKIVVMALLIFICFGRGHLLKDGIDEVLKMKQNFSNDVLSTNQKLIATSKMVQGCFIALPSIIRDGFYFWDNLYDTISYLSFAIVLIMVIGIIKNRKDLFVNISSIWTLFSVILFVFLNWSPHESPLFVIYFSWAIIPLFVMGLDYILNLGKINRKAVYITMIIFMLSINILTLIDVGRFVYTL